VEFLISVDITAPPEIVWPIMADVERWHEWTPSVRSIRLLDQPLRIGSRAIIRQPRFPPALWTITALEPGRGFTWKSGLPGMWVHADHSVEPVPGGTRATLRLRYEGALARVLGRLTRGITKRYLDYEASGLKARGEAVAAGRAAGEATAAGRIPAPR
jgi:hypothetical protein